MEIFPLANGFAKPFIGEIVLLHVLDRRPNAAQWRGQELDLRRAKRHLERIGSEYLLPTVEASFRVRVGVPHEEIIAEAVATNVDLILLPTFIPSVWRRLVGANSGATARELVAGATCRIFVVDVRTRFNCFRHWTGEVAAG